jgi:hypothetical protein
LLWSQTKLLSCVECINLRVIRPRYCDLTRIKSVEPCGSKVLLAYRHKDLALTGLSLSLEGPLSWSIWRSDPPESG